MGPLLAYLGSALSPDATASPAQLPADLAAVEMALRVVGRLSGSTGHSGGGTVEDGAGARELQCPHLRAAAKLSSLQRRLQSLQVRPTDLPPTATASSSHQWDEPQACGHAGAKSRASQQRRTCLALIDDLLRRVRGGSTRVGLEGTLCGRCTAMAPRESRVPQLSAWEGKPAWWQQEDCDAHHSCTSVQAAATPEAVAVGAGTASDGMTFQSEWLQNVPVHTRPRQRDETWSMHGHPDVHTPCARTLVLAGDLLVGGRPVQVLSVVQRHEDRASDGSVHVRYTFEDRVRAGGTQRRQTILDSQDRQILREMGRSR